MTRKRSGKTLIHQLMHQCATCHGLGFVKSVSNESYSILRSLKEELESKQTISTAYYHYASGYFYLHYHNEYNAILHLKKPINVKLYW